MLTFICEVVIFCVLTLLPFHPAKKYWRENTTLLKEGLDDCGRLQKYLESEVVSRIKEVVPPQVLERFLSANDIEEQKLLFKTLPLNEIRNIIK